MATPERREFIAEIEADTAYANTRSNRFSTWPNRFNDDEANRQNRVEPLCQPEFQAPFKINPGSSVFTIGSCFARNVEKSLIKLGFDIPTHRALPPGTSTAVLNNYTSPSMLNEVRWALSPDHTFDPETHLYKLTDTKVADLHLGGRWSRPTDMETAKSRRAALTSANTELANCGLLVLTLGLAEAWYDRELGLYLNSAPLKSFIAKYPGRFVVRVLSQSQIVESLHELIGLASNANTKGGLNVVVTVSPVPLSSTFRPDLDVIIANSYSKCTLRSAAEEIVQSYDFATYFPSFESITISDRNQTWEDDQVHVRQPLIDLNISRMVARFVDEDPATIEDPDVITQLAKNALDKKDTDQGLALIDRALELDPGHERAAELKINALFQQDDYEGAVGLYEAVFARGGSASIDILLLVARSLNRLKRRDEAIALIAGYVSDHPTHMGLRSMLGDLHRANKEFDKAEAAFKACLEISNRVGMPYFKLAGLAEARGDLGMALQQAKIAVTINPTNPRFKALVERLEGTVE